MYIFIYKKIYTRIINRNTNNLYEEYFCLKWIIIYINKDIFRQGSFLFSYVSPLLGWFKAGQNQAYILLSVEYVLFVESWM